MLFTSLPFLVLMLVTLGLFYTTGLRRLQTAILILASAAFYAWGQPALLALLLGSATINACASHAVARSNDPNRARAWAVIGVTANLAILATFKYGALVADSLTLSAASGPGAFLLTLPLPIGISFYTFQGISLVVDVFRNRQTLGPADGSFLRHWQRTVFYIAFFPQLVAGPIVKAHEFWPQIVPKRWNDIAWGPCTRTLILGFFLKMVIADNLKDQTFWVQYPYFLGRSGIELAALLFGYSMQIFADFAGYSLIAIGCAGLFGYRLPSNFDFPYVARSVSEFWRRWHISLSTWLREYLYIPLGGNRFGAWRTYGNLLLVMFLGGLWHGAAWSYAIWGLWHGIALAIERPLLRTRLFCAGGAWADAARMVAVFSFVTLSWLLFKLPEFPQAIAYLTALPRVGGSLDPVTLLMVAAYSTPVIAWHLLHLARRKQPELLRGWGRDVLYAILLAAIILNPGSPGAFIYFQF